MKKFFQRLDNSSSRHHHNNHPQGDYNRENLGGGNVGAGGGSAPLGSSQSSASSSYGGSFIGKVFTLGQYHCTVEDIIAEGGFALVFLVKAQSSLGRFALKRLHVNNEADLANCRREIEIAVGSFVCLPFTFQLLNFLPFFSPPLLEATRLAQEHRPAGGVQYQLHRLKWRLGDTDADAVLPGPSPSAAQ